MARKFLYAIVVLIVLIFGVRLLLRLYAEDLTEAAFVPRAEFTARADLRDKAYDDPAMWLARPDLGAKDHSRWLPPGVARPESPLDVAVFFVHPTSFIETSAWNADLDNAESAKRATLFVQGMASPFNAAAEVWAPRYRQAAIGAFLTDDPQAMQALDLAYRDVEDAFAKFIAQVPAGRPIVLAGHSQGGFILRRIIAEHVAGTPLARRVAAAYIIGWPVSIAHDLPAMALDPCATPDDAHCVISWLSVADPPETEMLLKAYARKPGLDGQPVGGSAFICTNPLTGRGYGFSQETDPGVGADANLGTLVPDFATETATLAPKAVPAACGADNFLHIGPPPDLKMGPYVLPGNNYHLYDVTLFWANLRADFARRVAAWHGNGGAPSRQKETAR